MGRPMWPPAWGVLVGGWGEEGWVVGLTPTMAIRLRWLIDMVKSGGGVLLVLVLVLVFRFRCVCVCVVLLSWTDGWNRCC